MIVESFSSVIIIRVLPVLIVTIVYPVTSYSNKDHMIHKVYGKYTHSGSSVAMPIGPSSLVSAIFSASHACCASNRSGAYNSCDRNIQG